MGNCLADGHFKAKFSVDLRELYGQYLAVVEYMRESNLFASDSPELRAVVERYMTDRSGFSRKDQALNAVHAVHKLHPLDYNTSKVTVDWLVDACVRQHKFTAEFPMQNLTFQESYKHYVEFLFLCTKNKGSVTVPNKMADFMWHSHMQDNQAYKSDTKKMLGFVLNHTDDYSEQKLNNYSQMTDALRAQYLAKTEPKVSVRSEPKKEEKPKKEQKSKPKPRETRVEPKVSAVQAVIEPRNTHHHHHHRHHFIDYGPTVYWDQPAVRDPVIYDPVIVDPVIIDPVIVEVGPCDGGRNDFCNGNDFGCNNDMGFNGPSVCGGLNGGAGNAGCGGGNGGCGGAGCGGVGAGGCGGGGCGGAGCGGGGCGGGGCGGGCGGE